MAFLNDNDRSEIKKMLEEMQNPVKLVVFKKNEGCTYCQETAMLLDEVSQLNEKLSLEIIDVEEDVKAAQEYGIDKVPAVSVVGDKDYGIRFFGIPAGYEFSALLGDIIDVSKGDSGLAERSRKELAKIDFPVRIQVFVTPSCPYCPAAVRMAHKFALENEYITGEMVEAQEFPELAQKYHVYAVPKIVVNDEVEFEGALPEPHFVKQVLRLLK
ncbi:MAG: thioredoxin family protein [Candidatus Aminicenantes bacterium]|nr:thioredoxin family protein [Candidatus Aminicenantes bacterium]